MNIASRSPRRTPASARVVQNSRYRRRMLLERLEDRSLLAGFNFADFSDSSALSLLGDAAITADNRLRLTPAIGSQEGAAWYTAEKQFVGSEFSTTFQFQMADNFDSGGGSDGFTFIIQNFAPTYLSGGGGTLGYYGLPNSLVVEFDTFSNFEVNDPSGSHISVHTNGTGPNDWSESLSLGSYNTNPIMDDANVHLARIAYMQGTLSVYLDDLTTPKLTVNVDLPNTLSLDAGTAWLGFTGTTGGGYQTHDILNWNFDATIPPTIVSIDNASQLEGNSGSSDFVFNVTRSGDLSAAATVDWTTVDGSATASSGDYAAGSGQVSFAAGEASQTIAVAVNGDTTIESHETFSVKLTGATSGFVLDSVGAGTILNDETSISINEATATEGDSSLHFVDEFVSAGSGDMSLPYGVAVGPDGNLYITQERLGVVKRFDGQTGEFIDVFADGSGVANQASQVVFQGDYLFVATGTTGILRFDATSGAPAPAAGKAGAQFATPIDQGVIQGVHGVAFGPDGHLYLTSNVSNQVLKYDGSTGDFLAEYVAAGSGGLDAANALVFGADGDLYVASSGNNSVLRYQGPLNSTPGAFIDTFVASGTGGLDWIPTGGLRFGPDGDLYVVSRDTHSILRFDSATGALRETAVPAGEGGLASPRGFTFDGHGRLLVTSHNTDNVLRYGATSEAAFLVTLAQPSGVQVIVEYSTADGAAGAGDYTPISGTITFAPGQTSRTILVQTLDDTVYEGNETFVVNLSNASGGLIVDSQGLGTIVDNEPPPTKFYVVDDSALDQNFEYGADGTAVENYAIAGGNTAPRGAASTAAGERVWVGDVNRNVYVYDPAGGLVGSWTAGSLPAKGPQVQGIATDGADVWIVDGKSDKVYLYSGAASRTAGSQNADSSFALNSGNKSPVGIVTDGTSLWVVNNAAQDKVFKYTLSGTLLGSWTMSGGGGAPTGITLDPASPSALWIVDNNTDRVYQYDGAVSRTSGSAAADAFFDLAAGNTNPQGIADPPVTGDMTGLQTTLDAAVPPTLDPRLLGSESHRVQTAVDRLLADSDDLAWLDVRPQPRMIRPEANVRFQPAELAGNSMTHGQRRAAAEECDAAIQLITADLAE